MVDIKVVVIVRVVVVVCLFTGSHWGGGLFWSGWGRCGRVRYGRGFCANKNTRYLQQVRRPDNTERQQNIGFISTGSMCEFNRTRLKHREGKSKVPTEWEYTFGGFLK